MLASREYRRKQRKGGFRRYTSRAEGEKASACGPGVPAKAEKKGISPVRGSGGERNFQYLRACSTGESRKKEDFAGTHRKRREKKQVLASREYRRKQRKRGISPVRGSGGGRNFQYLRACSTGESREKGDFAGTHRGRREKKQVLAGREYRRKQEKRGFRRYTVRQGRKGEGAW